MPASAAAAEVLGQRSWRHEAPEQQQLPYSVRQREDEERRKRTLAQRQAERDAKRVERRMSGGAAKFDPTAFAKRRADLIAQAKEKRQQARNQPSFGVPETDDFRADDDDKSEPPPPPGTPPPVRQPRAKTTTKFFENANDDVVIYRGGAQPKNRVVAKITRTSPKRDSPKRDSAKDEADETFRQLLRGGSSPPKEELKKKKKRPVQKEPPLLPPRLLEARRQAALADEIGRLDGKRSKAALADDFGRLDVQDKKRSMKGATPLCVRREKEQRRRERDQQRNDPKDVETRRCLDKRTARLRYARDFAAAVENYRSTASPKAPQKLGARVIVRVRPLLTHEASRGEFAAISADLDPRSVTIHYCTMHADMVRLQHAARTFPCSEALPPSCTDDDAYRAACKPALDAALDGAVAAVFMFGQTGSGKTFTMSSIEARVASDLFHEPTDRFDDDDLEQQKVAIRYFEIKGKKAFDLLRGTESTFGGGGASPNLEPHEIKLVDDDRTCLTIGASVSVPPSSAAFGEALAAGKRHRATAATDVNGGSSRSHAVLRIDLSGGGSLMLIDCAGSERSQDSMYHEAERRKESAEINQSIYALKQCIRAANAVKKWNNSAWDAGPKPPPPPFRSSALTRVLREAFESDDAHVCVVATLSPAATDADHSVTTMSTVAQLAGLSDKALADCSPHPSIVPRLKSKPGSNNFWHLDHEHKSADNNNNNKKVVVVKKHSRSVSSTTSAASSTSETTTTTTTVEKRLLPRRPLAAKENHLGRQQYPPPRTWANDKLASFLQRYDKRAADRLLATGDLDGRNLTRMSAAAIAAALTDGDLQRATTILNALRDETTRCDNRRAIERARRRDDEKLRQRGVVHQGGRLPPFAFS